MQESDVRDHDARLARVRAAVLGELPRRQRNRRRATIGATAIGGLVLVGGVTGGAIIVNRASQQLIDHTAYCYSKADLNSVYGEVAFDLATPSPVPGASVPAAHDTPADPLELCAAVWRGGLGQARPTGDPDDLSIPTPVLVACKRADDVAATFPRGDSTASDRAFCADLGLAPWRG